MNKKEFADVIHGKPHVIIGKNYVSDGVIAEIVKQLEHFPYIKLKFHDIPIDSDIKEMMGQISSRTKSRVCDVRGKTAVLKSSTFKKR